MDLFPIKLQPSKEAPMWFVVFLSAVGLFANLCLMLIVAFVIAYGASAGWGAA